MPIPTHMVTTAFTLENHRIIDNLGVVRGITVRTRSLPVNFIAGLLTMFGGRSHLYAELCDRARQEAYELMIQHAEERGANAIIGFRYDATELMAGMTEVLAYGTACRVDRA